MSELKLREDNISSTVLGKIVAAKRQRLEARKKSEPLESFRGSLQPSARSLEDAIRSQKTAFIMECKKASPSKGLIRPDFRPAAIASVYRRFAQAVSVLAEEDFFQGSLDYLPPAGKKSGLPVICKDFIIDEYQLYLARKYQADAVLLMLSVLTDEAYSAQSATAASLGLDVLTEAGTEEEVARAVRLGARIIGINNRDLKNLAVDLDRTRKLAPKIPADRLRICESGIFTNADVRELAPLVNGFLVGSSLTSQPDIASACRQLVYGCVKICGLTRHADAVDAQNAGATYGGLIFAPGSRRRVSAKHAANIARGVNLKFVGVFRDQSLDEVAKTADLLHLSGVQLHGREDEGYIRELRSRLAPRCQIVKAVAVDQSGALDGAALGAYAKACDRVLLDTRNASGFGGTGVSFNLKAVDQAKEAVAAALGISARQAAQHLMVAGGLGPENVAQAASLGVHGVDLNSGVESAPGIKDRAKIEQVFAALRNYF